MVPEERKKGWAKEAGKECKGKDAEGLGRTLPKCPEEGTGLPSSRSQFHPPSNYVSTPPKSSG